MRFYMAIAVLLLSGCGAMKQTTIEGNKSVGASAQWQRDRQNTPKVVFIGDEITLNWFPKTAYWINKGVAGETSDKTLARFQADVVSLHPDIVHILIGTNDVYPGWDFCGYGTSTGAPVVQINTCANIAQMESEAQAAGIKVIVGTIPPRGAPDPVAVSWYENITELNAWLGAPIPGSTDYSTPPGVTLVDYHLALSKPSQVLDFTQEYATGLTANGVDPDAAGYAIMTPLAQAAIAHAQAAGEK
jgi:lysophospholipase L1-like esterase